MVTHTESIQQINSYYLRVFALLPVRTLPPLISCCQVVTLFHQNVESTGFVAVADVQQDLAAHPGVAIVTGLTVHAHHAVYTTLLGKDQRLEGVEMCKGEEGQRMKRELNR